MRDERLAVAVAYASVEQSRIHMQKIIPRGTGYSDSVATTGQMIACSVNLLYAIELLLKATLSAFKKASGSEHDLWKLYTKLPRDVQNAVEVAYDEREGTGSNQSFGVAIRTVSDPENGFTPPASAKGMREVLKSSRSKYSQFRYAFEYEGESSQALHLHLQFGDLLRAADCMIQIGRAHV